nr:MAG TPA: hypothetical protein [Caudoviricetes sp.]
MHFCTYFFSVCSRFCGTYLLTKSKKFALTLSHSARALFSAEVNI